MTRRFLLPVLAALLGAAAADARIVQVQGPNGPGWTNVPEPAAGVDVKPSKRAERWRPALDSARQ